MEEHRCKYEGNIEVTLAEIKKDIDYIRKSQQTAEERWETHIEQSVCVRDTVKKNESFAKGATKALWIVFGVISGLVIKALKEMF